MAITTPSDALHQNDMIAKVLGYSSGRSARDPLDCRHISCEHFLSRGAELRLSCLRCLRRIDILGRHVLARLIKHDKAILDLVNSVITSLIAFHDWEAFSMVLFFCHRIIFFYD